MINSTASEIRIHSIRQEAIDRALNYWQQRTEAYEKGIAKTSLIRAMTLQCRRHRRLRSDWNRCVKVANVHRVFACCRDVSKLIGQRERSEGSG
jgi:hypothetical protein